MQVEAVLRRAENLRGLSSSSSLRQPPLRPLGRYWTLENTFQPILNKTGSSHSQKGLSILALEITVTMQVPLPSLPLLPPHLPLWNLRSPPRFQWGHRGRRRPGRDDKERSCQMPSASPLQWLILSCVLYQVFHFSQWNSKSNPASISQTNCDQ